MKSINVISLFDGISCGQVALTRLGININNYFAYEIDKNAIKCAKYNFPKMINCGDVRNVLIDNHKDIDLIIGGPECKSYSVAGKMDSSGMWQIELFKECVDKYSPKYFLMENVGSKKQIVNEIDKIMGVKNVLINSNLVSPQNRLRRYWTNFDIAPISDWDILLEDISNDIPICLSSSGRGKNGVERRLSSNKKAHTLTASGYSNRSFSGFITKEQKIRVFNQQEMEMIQTLPIGYTSSLSFAQAKKAIGNGWTVDVIVEILKNIRGNL
jgi:site-specific DNA-cytosine methylase